MTIPQICLFLISISLGVYLLFNILCIFVSKPNWPIRVWISDLYKWDRAMIQIPGQDSGHDCAHLHDLMKRLYETYSNNSPTIPKMVPCSGMLGGHDNAFRRETNPHARAILSYDLRTKQVSRMGFLYTTPESLVGNLLPSGSFEKRKGRRHKCDTIYDAANDRELNTNDTWGAEDDIYYQTVVGEGYCFGWPFRKPKKEDKVIMTTIQGFTSRYGELPGRLHMELSALRRLKLFTSFKIITNGKMHVLVGIISKCLPESNGKISHVGRHCARHYYIKSWP